MKKKRTFTFHSTLDSHQFLARIQEVVEREDLLIGQSKNAFNLRIDSNHGGNVFYQACIFPDERGGSRIHGEIINVNWFGDKKRTKFQKVMGGIGLILWGIAWLPVIILIMLFAGSYELFLLFKNKGKRELPRAEKNLFNVMLNELCCTQIVD